MKKTQIQVHRGSDDKSVSQLLDILMRSPTAREIHVHKIPSQRYVNISVLAPSIRKLWGVIRRPIERSRNLRLNTIVVCEGKHGWDDYELIYHMNPDEIDPKWK
jgi:hypothetical protein